MKLLPIPSSCINRMLNCKSALKHWRSLSPGRRCLSNTSQHCLHVCFSPSSHRTMRSNDQLVKNTPRQIFLIHICIISIWSFCEALKPGIKKEIHLGPGLNRLLLLVLSKYKCSGISQNAEKEETSF